MCPIYDIKQSDDETSVMGNVEHPYIAITTGFTLARIGSTDKVMSMGEIGVFSI